MSQDHNGPIIEIEVEVISSTEKPLPCKHHFTQWYRDECTLSYKVRCGLCKRTGSIPDYKAYAWSVKQPYPHSMMSVDCMLHLGLLSELADMDPEPETPTLPPGIGSISATPQLTLNHDTNHAK